MLLLRYFLVVGSVLLCGLFVADRYLPRQPVREHADFDRSIIRIKPTSHEDVPGMWFVMPPSKAADEAAVRRRTRRAFAAMPERPRRKRTWKNTSHRHAAPDASAIHRLPEDFATW